MHGSTYVHICRPKAKVRYNVSNEPNLFSNLTLKNVNEIWIPHMMRGEEELEAAIIHETYIVAIDPYEEHMISTIVL